MITPDRINPNDFLTASHAIKKLTQNNILI